MGILILTKLITPIIMLEEVKDFVLNLFEPKTAAELPDNTRSANVPLHLEKSMVTVQHMVEEELRRMLSENRNTQAQNKERAENSEILSRITTLKTKIVKERPVNLPNSESRIIYKNDAKERFIIHQKIVET